jgi:uncharacterized protein YqgC (DUF456 family)
MALWWIGNIVLIAVVIPVVVLLLRGVLDAAVRTKKAVDAIAEVGGAMVADLEYVVQLVTTQNFVSQTTAGLTRYGGALDRIL